jgi:NADPH:quinone reductase-like Zn-dependent oxidoreductase
LQQERVSSFIPAVKKIVIHRAGSFDRLKLEEHADLVPGPDEVIVRTQAVGVNYADCIVRMGLYESAKKYVGWPITPGFEFAGTVWRLGEQVKDLAVGGRVFGVTRFDAYASEVKAKRHQLFAIPDGLDMAHAAGFPSVFLTAWYALVELCRLRPGMKVLVHSAAGGVGGALGQIAKLHDCHVVGVVGASHKVEPAKKHRFDRVIDKSRENLWAMARAEAAEGYDVVLDANGVETLRESYAHLRPTGRLVIYGFHTMMSKHGGRPNYGKLAVDWLRTPRFNPLTLTNDNKSVMAFNLSYLFDEADRLREGMGLLLAWLREGKLHAHEVECFPLAEVARAHEKIESGTSVGKLVLSV